jgi:hypothetical protein
MSKRFLLVLFSGVCLAILLRLYLPRTRGVTLSIGGKASRYIPIGTAFFWFILASVALALLVGLLKRRGFFG